ncbi:hypothetical protein LJC45_05035 [Alistipes sp. OttesenSCG-928-B03]|nr:hypothetical protein [Alistipes sp. OttesenSCG-928-B03]
MNIRLPLCFSISVCLSCLLFPAGANAQITNISTVYSEVIAPTTPETDFLKYGNVDVSHRTGANSFAIPVYTYKDQDFELPISIQYTSTGYKPNNQTGHLGLGWILNAGGIIMREVRGCPDEHTREVIIHHRDGQINYYRHGFASIKQWDQSGPNNTKIAAKYVLQNHELPSFRGEGYYYALGNPKDDYSKKEKENNIEDGGHYFETTTDEYYFRYPGNSGSFVFQADINKDKVLIKKSDQPHGELSSTPGIGSNDSGLSDVKYEMSESGFASFTITDGLGYKYEFGNSSELKNHSFQQSPPISNSDFYYQSGLKSSWPLTKITAPNGRNITFEYESKINNKSFIDYTYKLIGQADALTGIPAYCADSVGYTKFYEFDQEMVLKYMSRLKSITIDNKIKIHFVYGAKKNENVMHLGSNDRLSHPIPNNGKLESIVVYELTSSGSLGRIIKRCDLNYDYAVDGDPVMLLKDAMIWGEGKYSFSYYNAINFPKHGTTNVDRWKYYNGFNVEENDYKMRPINTSQDSDFGSTMKGMLMSVVYPTGGASLFEYEQNDYSATLVNQGGRGEVPYAVELARCVESQGGGVRIKSITEISNPGAPSHSYDTLSYKRYTYKHEGRSSGISYCRPFYIGAYSNDNPLKNVYSDVIERLGLNSYMPVSFEGADEIMEYSHVTELLADGSSIEYQYTSYLDTPDTPADLSVIRARYDEVGGMSQFLQYLVNPRPYSRADHRGKILSVVKKDSAGDVVETDEYIYPNLNDIEYQEEIMLDGRYVYVYHLYTGPFDVQKSINTKYFNSGADRMVAETSYEYNSRGQVNKTETTYSNDTKKYINQTKYVHEEPTSSLTVDERSIPSQRPKYPRAIMNSVTEGNSETLVDETRFSYKQFNGLPKLYSVKKALTPVSTGAYKTYVEDMRCELYDRQGYLLEKTNSLGIRTCYVWGYGGLYPVAIIENSPAFSVIKELLDATWLNMGPLPGRLTAAQISALQSIDGSSVTTFEYNPFIGVTGITDASGRKTTHSYYETGDYKHGKPSEVKDHNGETINTYHYNINRQ